MPKIRAVPSTFGSVRISPLLFRKQRSQIAAIRNDLDRPEQLEYRSAAFTMLTSKTMVLLFAGFIGPGLIGCRTAPSPQSYSKFLLAADRSFSRTAEEH